GNAPSRLREHHFGCLDDCGNGVACLQFHLFGATARDHGLNDTIANPYRNVREYVTQLNLFDRTLQMIASAQSHRASCAAASMRQNVQNAARTTFRQRLRLRRIGLDWRATTVNAFLTNWHVAKRREESLGAGNFEPCR